jgi:polar amino acid transport system substrate-binding protein
LKGDFPPYAYPDGDAYRGIDVDVCRAVCDIIGVELEIKAFPNDELITMIRYGKADIAAGGLYPSEDSGEQCDFSVPYASCEQVILVRK